VTAAQRQQPDVYTARLLAELAASTPRLPGAACVGQHELFDLTVGHALGTAAAQHRALKVCYHCPVLQKCRRFILSLPVSERPKGVAGGQITPYTDIVFARRQRRRAQG